MGVLNGPGHCLLPLDSHAYHQRLLMFTPLDFSTFLSAMSRSKHSAEAAVKCVTRWIGTANARIGDRYRFNLACLVTLSSVWVIMDGPSARKSAGRAAARRERSAIECRLCELPAILEAAKMTAAKIGSGPVPVDVS